MARTRRYMTRLIMAAFAVLMLAATTLSTPTVTKADDCCRTAYVSCQSASWKGGPSWNYPTVRTLYYGDNIGVRRNYSGGYYYENGFYLAQDYGWTGDHYWGYIWAACTTWR